MRSRGKFELKSGARLAAAAGLGLTLALGAAPVVAMAEGASGQEQAQYAVMIDDKGYESLGAAIQAATNGAVITITADIDDAVGISVPSGKNLTVDFGGHTYTLAGPGAGSEGTETNGFQLLRGSNLTFKNGTIRIAEGCESIKRVFQSYANVTFENLTIDATNQAGSKDYPLSFNCGNVVFKGNTNIKGSSSMQTAFDVCYWPSGGYTEGVSVTFDSSFVGRIDGAIVYDSTNPSKAKLKVYGNGMIVGITKSEAAKSIDPDITVYGGVIQNGIDEDFLAPGMRRDEESGQIVLKDDNVAVVSVGETGQVLGGYSNLADAVSAASEGDVVNLVKDVTVSQMISVDAGILITADEGVSVTVNEGITALSLNANGAELYGIDFKLTCAQGSSATTEIVHMNSGTCVDGCTFIGNYADGDDQVSRGIVGVAGATDLIISNNTFSSIRQPGYINNCAGSITGNTVTGTRGWVICGDSRMSITGETFSDNAVDIAIIANGADATNNYADRLTQLGKDNGGAYVQDQIADAESKGGSLVVGSSGSAVEYTLQAALNAAQPGDTVRLEGNVTCGAVTVPDGVTLDGNGFTITLDSELGTGAFVTVGSGASVKDLGIDADANAKHGVQFYQVQGGSLENCSVTGSYYTAVIVNGSTDIKISGCELSPAQRSDQEKPPYANIELAMGGNVTTVPSVILDGNKFGGDATHQVWVDYDTVGLIKENAHVGEGDVLDYVNGRVTNLGSSDVTVTVQLTDGGKGEDTVVDGVRPVTPPSQSGDAVKVEQSEGGKVSVTPTRADEGDEVTITATPDEGQEVREVKVVDEDGNEVQVKAGEKDGEFVFEMPDGAVTVTVTFGCDGGELCPTHGFNDVDQGAWYHDAVDWAVSEGVLNGYGEGGESLGPVADVTRAEMAQMLWNRAGRPEAEADLSGFGDVSAEGWYAPALEWCVSEGIFSGYGDTFGTERTISREEAVTVLWRLAGSPEADADLSGYGDASSVSGYATGAIEWAVSEGVLTGKGNVALDPQAGCTRGEVAAMMMRMAQ